MKRFVIVGHKALSTGAFKLDDICGGGGRVDVLSRFVTACIMSSHGVRNDSEVYLLMLGGEDAPKTIRVEGSSVRYLNPDERSTSSLIRNACLKKIPQNKEIVSSPGISVSKKGLDDLLSELQKSGTVVYLKEDGSDVRDFEFPENPIFVFGDNSDLTPEEESIVHKFTPSKISIGPKSLLASHCAVILHNELDRRGL